MSLVKWVKCWSTVHGDTSWNEHTASLFDGEHLGLRYNTTLSNSTWLRFHVINDKLYTYARLKFNI